MTTSFLQACLAAPGVSWVLWERVLGRAGCRRLLWKEQGGEGGAVRPPGRSDGISASPGLSCSGSSACQRRPRWAVVARSWDLSRVAASSGIVLKKVRLWLRSCQQTTLIKLMPPREGSGGLSPTPSRVHQGFAWFNSDEADLWVMMEPGGVCWQGNSPRLVARP